MLTVRSLQSLSIVAIVNLVYRLFYFILFFLGGGGGFRSHLSSTRRLAVIGKKLRKHCKVNASRRLLCELNIANYITRKNFVSVISS